MRCLEIGPGKRGIKGFETLDVIKRPGVDHVGDARRLPFKDGTFGILYASHIIEHLPWYDTIDVLKEWRRVLAVGGALEVWTINAITVAEKLIEYERSGDWEKHDGWKRHGVNTDPYLWCNGRIFAYGKNDDDYDSVFWHRALFTPKHLMACFRNAGLRDIGLMERAQVRGKDHGHVNLGVRGVR
jgi:ubiquinone/menaquinone biosynthesis C-methylase UbiE